jgi:hypothetical protein
MADDECSCQMLAELKVLVDKLTSSKTEAEGLAIQNLAVEVMDACRIRDPEQKKAAWKAIKPKLASV